MSHRASAQITFSHGSDIQTTIMSQSFSECRVWNRTFSRSLFPSPPSPSPPPPHSNRLLIVQHSADGREIYPPRSRQSSISRVPTVNFLNEFWQDALGRGGGEWNPSRPTDHDNSAWDFAFWYSTRCHLLPRPLAHPDWRSNSSCPI